MEKRSGSRIDPCDTPDRHVVMVDRAVPTVTFCVRSTTKDRNQSIAAPSIPKSDLDLSNRTVWSTASNAAEMSSANSTVN
jgi:hypothetical protein